MKKHASRKGSLAYSRRKAKSLVPTGKQNEVAIWGTKVGITSLLLDNKFTVVTLIELAKMSPTSAQEGIVSVKSRFFKKPFLRTTEYKENIPVGGLVKVQSLTKGKGYIGVVKMHGIKLGKRKRARANKERHIGCIAPRTGNTTYTSPMGGHKRPMTRTTLTRIIEVPTELSEQVYHRYGYIKGKFIAIKGSIPGNNKQIVKLRLLK